MDENLAMFVIGCSVVILGASCLFLQEEFREMENTIDWLETQVKAKEREIEDIRFGRETNELWRKGE